jgi:alkanesulfonate monooxygenase
MLLPTGRSCDDAWIAASALIPTTQKMRFLVAVRLGLITPTITARMVATFDQISSGRLLINVVAGGDPVELAGDGLHLKHDQRYELTGEFLHIFRRVLNGESVDFAGDYLQVQDAKLFRLGVQRPYPELWFGGSSSIGQRIAAEHVDVYLTRGEPPVDVAGKIDSVRKAAHDFGRSLRFGLRVHIIVRDTEKEAWEATEDLLRYVSDESITAASKGPGRTAFPAGYRLDILFCRRRGAAALGPRDQ